MSESLADEALARDLQAKLQGLASISDQSGGRTVLNISGRRARDVLAKGLPIDLDPRAFPLGSAATSAISHMGVQLWQMDDTRSYDIAIFRSLSESFWRWLPRRPPNTATRSCRSAPEARVVGICGRADGAGQAASSCVFKASR